MTYAVIHPRFITTQSSPRLQLWCNFLFSKSSGFPITNVTVYICHSSSLFCLILSIFIFLIFWHLVCSRNIDLYIYLIFSFHFINRYHETLLEWFDIFIISSFSYFPFSDDEMTHVTIGLRRTCSSPCPWPGHPPSVWPVSPCAIACVCMRRGRSWVCYM